MIQHRYSSAPSSRAEFASVPSAVSLRIDPEPFNLCSLESALKVPQLSTQSLQARFRDLVKPRPVGENAGGATVHLLNKPEANPSGCALVARTRKENADMNWKRDS